MRDLIRKPTTVSFQWPGGNPPLWTVGLNNLRLGNHKYGSPQVAKLHGHSPIGPPQEFRINCIQGDVHCHPTQGDSFFYNTSGVFGAQLVTHQRAFRLRRRPASLTLGRLLDGETELRFNSSYRRWALSRLSKLTTVAEILADITTLKLLHSNVLTFHAAAVKGPEGVILLTGLPDTGKTFTTLSLMREGYDFVSEDLVLLTPSLVCHGLPFTQTVEKRKPKSTLGAWRSRLYEAFAKQNYTKTTVLETDMFDGKNVSGGGHVRAVFFLKRGALGIRQADPQELLSDLIALSRLEFTYWRNELILTYLFLNGGPLIDHFLHREVQFIRALAEGTKLFIVTAPSHEGYSDLVRRHTV